MIRVEGIHKAFGKNQVLNGIDLTVEKGEVVAVIGPSGSGKTTLLRCLNFLERADAGRLSIGATSVDFHHAPSRLVSAIRRQTAMVFQNYNLFANKTVVENVMEGLVTARKVPIAEARSRAERVLTQVGLAEKLDAYPARLSGGQQQRVGIARALALNPEVILFDEPTSALDPELVGEVLAVIQKVAQSGITMVIVTHEIAFAAEVASRVVFMDGGLIVEQGPPALVLSRPQEERTRQFLKRILPEANWVI